MKKTLPLLLMLVLLVQACKKDDTTGTNNGTNNSETQLEMIELSTSYGKMYIWLFDQTPLHKANFLKLAKEGYYDGTTFHRVIPNFMIQGGDPNSKDSNPSNDGQGGPGYTVPAEIKAELKHDRGSLAAARLGDAQNPSRASSGSQFYISVSKSGTQGLDGQYTVFGKVIKGIEFADPIVSAPVGANNRPVTDIPMTVKVIKKTKAEIKTEFGYSIPE